MRQERGEHTLQATALVHEVYLRLADKDRIQWRSRAHFVAVAATLMRRVLVDHARAVRAEKRGGRAARISLDAALAELPTSDVDLLALDDALARLARLDERKARVVELRFFGGLSVEQAAEVLGVSPRSVESDWSVARAFLRRELTEAAPDQDGVR
jgi:RNA polymerase sigma factor (TIGR02999 family)